MEKTFYCTFSPQAVRMYDAITGAHITNLMPALSSGATITNASCDTTGQYVTVTCSNKRTFVYKKRGSSSWSLHRQYMR